MHFHSNRACVVSKVWGSMDSSSHRALIAPDRAKGSGALSMASLNPGQKDPTHQTIL